MQEVRSKIPKISIIVPVYNSEKYLDKCIRSLVNQTLKDIELILVNDGSTDNSLKILQAYELRDNRIVLLDQVNSGVAIARNNAIKLANGEYLAFLDSDDFLDEEALDNIYTKAKDNSSDIVLFGYKRIKESGYKVNEFIPPATANFHGNAMNELLRNNISSIACDKLFKTSFLKKYNIFFMADTYYEDSLFVFQVISHAKNVTSIEHSYYNWLIRGQSRSNSVSEIHIKNMFDILRRSKKHLIDNNIYEIYKDDFLLRYFRHSVNMAGNKVLLINNTQLRIIMAIIFMKEIQKDGLLDKSSIKIIKSTGLIPERIISIYEEILDLTSLDKLYEIFSENNVQSVPTFIDKLKRKYRNIKKRIKDRI